MKHLHLIKRSVAKEFGLLRYYTGKPCKRGHIAQRLVSIGHCYECLREVQTDPKLVAHKKQRYAENKEAVLAVCKVWRENNKERKQENSKKWYAANRSKVIENTRRWREQDPQRARLLNQTVYLKNWERNRERNRKWAKENSHSERALKAEKRALKRKASPLWSRDLTRFVFEEACDKAKMLEALTGFKWHVDHVVPIKGVNVVGLHVWYNLQLLPAALNLFKGNKLMFIEPYSWSTQ